MRRIIIVLPIITHNKHLYILAKQLIVLYYFKPNTYLIYADVLSKALDILKVIKNTFNNYNNLKLFTLLNMKLLH